MKKIEVTLSRSTGLEAALLAVESLGFTRFQAVRWLRVIESENIEWTGKEGDYTEVSYEFWIHLREMLTVRIDVRLKRQRVAPGAEWIPIAANGMALPGDGQCFWRFRVTSDTLEIESSDTEVAKKWAWFA